MTVRFPGSIKRRHRLEHRGNEFRECRMDVNCVRESGVGCARIHCAEDTVNCLVSTSSENGGSQNLFALRIHQYFHETLRFSFFYSASDFRHRASSDQGSASTLTYLGFGKTNPGQRRIDVKGTHRDAVTDAARGFVEEVVSYDLKVVVRGVSKGTSSVAISERPNSWDRGLQLIVYGYKSVLIRLDAGCR